MISKHLLRVLCGTLILPVAAAAADKDDVPMRAMKDELQRSMTQLRLQQMDKPYFLAYRMDEINDTEISATLGSLTNSQPGRMRMIGVEVRVGDYSLDNSNFFSARSFASGVSGMFSSISQAPLDDNYQQIRRQFWLATDTQYKKALEDLSAKRAALQLRKRSDEVPDFSKESPTSVNEAPGSPQVNVRDLESLARDLSAVFKADPDIFNSSVDLEYRDFYTRYVNSEGSFFTQYQPILKLKITAETQAPDGLPISDSIEIYGRAIADLPSKEALLKRAHNLAESILKLRSASSVESYNGPVLFEGEAAAEAFSQQFATGLMAVRTPISDDPRFEAYFSQMMSQLGGASFVDKVGGRVLPEFLSVTDNPLQDEFKNARLLGSYKIDDDAVASRETKLVDHGVLKTLLATRVPVRTIPHSTGSRRGWGPSPSNLFVTADKSLNTEDLHKELLRRAKERGLDYGIVVRHLGGGGAAGSFMRMTVRMAMQSEGGYSDSLAQVYKLYPDGHEELVKGLEIAEITPATFKEIAAAGDTPFVYTEEFVPRLGAFFSLGTAATSNVPVVSSVVPSLLFEELSLTKTQGPFPNPPISPSPLAKE